MVELKFDIEEGAPMCFTEKNEIGIKLVEEYAELFESRFSQTTRIPLETDLIIGHRLG